LPQPLTKLELITICVTAAVLGPQTGNAILDFFGSLALCLMLMVWLLYIKYGNPL
jgi:hypothetical protein